ncbi:phage tail protein [Pseudoalteromonas luteoviolacea]|uniref:phage tail-collar fiber domain-containing protein n=1 Tax=Pseudoalteromonas luteoviolacea TaxID=43657 RepID=UPI001152A56D|nr:phage tail protein [Pseudoalteromonas luteoviolacea]TQF70500.1 phage tail protein [Pseudoalteromonas luteoviolacea]
MTENITGILTKAGKQFIATQALNDKGLGVKELVFANIPNLNEKAERNPNEGMPPSLQIVYRRPIDVEGKVDDNTVAWAVILEQDIGDFDYNWIGLVTETGLLLAVDYLPMQRKRKGVNNVHNRSFVLKFAAAAALSRITIPAQSWMFDYSPQLDQINVELSTLAVSIINNMHRFIKQNFKEKNYE